jgi:hypothetical protein
MSKGGLRSEMLPAFWGSKRAESMTPTLMFSGYRQTNDERLLPGCVDGCGVGDGGGVGKSQLRRTNGAILTSLSPPEPSIIDVNIIICRLQGDKCVRDFGVSSQMYQRKGQKEDHVRATKTEEYASKDSLAYRMGMAEYNVATERR